MYRLLYTALLRLHPRAFRERFGEEMIDIFDEEVRNGRRVALLLDGVVSLFRQRLMRPGRREPVFATVGPVQPPGIPVFHMFESCPPRRSALVNGAVLSLILFGILSFAIGRGGGNFPRLLIGAKYPRPLVLPVDRSSIMGAEPSTAIKVKAPAEDPLYELANIYFKIVRVLDVLDADQDRILSAREIVTASSPLSRLDKDTDGKLSAEECGFFLGDSTSPKLDPRLEERARLAFMRLNPVLAALDADANGEISADEIENSSVTLRTLDHNWDGSLTPAEVLPEPVDNRATMILSRLDTNRDRKLSQQERATEEAEPLRELLEAADRNTDGVITAAELTNELQFRDELKKQTEKATGSAGVADPQDSRSPANTK